MTKCSLPKVDSRPMTVRRGPGQQVRFVKAFAMQPAI